MTAGFNFSLEKKAELALVGCSVLTDMDKAQKDCPALWEKTFMPLAEPLLRKVPAGTPTYGLSLVENLEKGTFHYWAALPWAGDAPENMKAIQVPEGLYVKCQLAGLGQLGAAYQAMFEYVHTNPELDFSPGAPSLEEYPADFPQPEVLFLYMPVKQSA